MFKILDRYLIREVTLTSAVVVFVLLAILVTNRLARILGAAAAGDLPRDAVFALLGLTSVYYLLILVPVGLFLGVMLTLGRMYRDSEMPAVLACGIGPLQLYRPLLLLAVVVAAVLGWMSMDAAPRAALQAQQMKNDAQSEAEVGTLSAGRFRSLDGGEAVFYAERVDAAGVLENVFLQRRRDGYVEVAVAARGEQRRDPATGERSMILYDGQRVEGRPGDVHFRIIDFREHGIPIRTDAREIDADDRELQATTALLGSKDPRDIAELQWRISIPVSALLLTVLAVPLSRTSPRQGRYGKLALAVLFYLFYANLLGATRLWVERGDIAPYPGLWAVHGAVLALATLLLWRQTSYRRVSGPAPVAAAAVAGGAG